jgi:hypothetical protein
MDKTLTEAVEIIRKIRQVVDLASLVGDTRSMIAILGVLDSTTIATIGWEPPTDERAKVVAYLLSQGEHRLADAILKGDHLRNK